MLEWYIETEYQGEAKRKERDMLLQPFLSSVTLDGMDLFSAGGLVIIGVVTSSVVGRFVPTIDATDRRLTTR